MAYEKYIKKDGKLYGPYIYHSKRVDGKVISEYRGTRKFNKNLLWIIPILLILVLGIYLLLNKNSGVTGNAVLDLNANYQENQPVKGDLDFVLQAGELIPADSRLIFENSGETYVYPLREMLDEQPIEGDFSVRGKDLGEFGEGFGIPGKKEIYPELTFILNLEKPNPTDSDSVLITEIGGSVSAEKNFTYLLEEGQSAEIKLKSVKLNGTGLSDDILELAEIEGKVIVSTDYSEDLSGFGEEYFGEEIKKLSLNLDQLGLVLNPGDLRVYLEYKEQELMTLSTIVGETTSEISEELVSGSSPETLQDTEIPETETLELTESERGILTSEFGNISVEVSDAVSRNGFLVLRYRLGNYWSENSYDEDLSSESLQNFMAADRVKFLKDIAKKLSEQGSGETEKEEFLGNYSYSA